MADVVGCVQKHRCRQLRDETSGHYISVLHGLHTVRLGRDNIHGQKPWWCEDPRRGLLPRNMLCW